MYLALSFPSTNFKDYLDFRRKNDKLLAKGIFGAKIPKPKPTGGKLAVVDWNRKKVVWECMADTPAGFIFDTGKFIVCDELGDKVVSINNKGQIKQFLSHPLFNYPHDITFQNGKYLVTSTGLDTILEFNSKGRLTYRWHSVEWGYDKTPEGEKRIIDYNKNHRGIRYATLERTTHINSAIYYNQSGGKILSTFFHTGQLVLIDKSTSKPRVILDGLDHLHAVHKGINNTFILSETGKNRIHILDSNLKTIKTLENKHNCEWIQDAVFTKKGTILIGDANKTRILETSYPDFKLIDVYEYDSNLKLFKIMDLYGAQIQKFVSANGKGSSLKLV